MSHISADVGGRSEHVAGLAAVRTRSPFFVVMALVLLVPITVGFAPTFYLRPVFGTRDPLGGAFPLHLIVHGLVLSAWYALFLAQTVLVAARRVDLHRRLGAIGLGLAVAVVTVSLVTLIRMVPRALALGASMPAIAQLLVGDGISLVQFAVFVGSGIHFRCRPATHKRLMFLAALAIINPAFSDHRPVGRTLGRLLPVWVPGLLVFLILCIGALVVYDLVTYKRVQTTTVWGICLTLLVYPATFFAWIASGVGDVLRASEAAARPPTPSPPYRPSM